MKRVILSSLLIIVLVGISSCGSFSDFDEFGNNKSGPVMPAGTLDTTFNNGTGANGPIWTIVPLSDGRIFIGGQFTSYNGTARNNIARLNADGSLDATFDPGSGTNHLIFSMAVMSDSKILICGMFTNYNGTARNCIARINADGTLDNSFNVGTGANGYIRSLSVQSDRKIIIGGAFANFNGTARNCIARINADGTLDNSFNVGTGTDNLVCSTAIQSNDKILIGGDFTSYNGTIRNGIARLNDDGSLDSSFNPITGANGTIYAIKNQTTGRRIIGGNFSEFNGITKHNFTRLSADGEIDPAFWVSADSNGHVYSIAVQNDRKILIGGNFSVASGAARNCIGRTLEYGTPDYMFDPGTGANDDVYSIAIQGNGRILIGGAFTSYNGTTVNGIARIFN